MAICGVPRAGKTTLGRSLSAACRSTDDLIPLGWSEASEAASRWFDDPDPALLVEGVGTVRALRKWLERNRTGRPVDAVVWLERPRERLSAGQETMAKGCRTVFREIRAELRRRGVTVEER